MNNRLFLLAATTLLIATLGWIGHALHFTTFMLYDDEGYVLITLRDFGRHGGLYEKVFSQYGPLFYLFYDTLQRLLDFAWTNTTGRWITLVNWIGTAAICGWIVQRASHWSALALVTLASAFAYLWIMIHEPMHPGSTIALWVGLAAYFGYEALRAGRMNWFAALGGAMGAALALIKINVGAFFIFAVGTWLLLGGVAARNPKFKLTLILGGFVLPVALMRPLLHEPWIQVFALVSGCTIVATLLGSQRTIAEQPTDRTIWGWFIGGGLIVTASVAIGMVLNGTSLTALVQGVLIAPIKHPAVYSFPMFWRPGVIAVTLTGLGLAVWAWRCPDDLRVRRVIAWTRLIAVFLLQFSLLPQFAAGQATTSLSYGIPLAGIFAFPLLHSGVHRRAAIARAWLAVLLGFQILHAYPVAGSQINWGSFLWMPLMALGLHEALAFLTANKPKVATTARLAATCVTVLLIGNLIWLLGWHALRYRKNGERLEVPGAFNVQVPEQIASALRIVTENASAHADMLFSLPGTYSLNLWADVPTPTLANTTHWFSLLSDDQQKAWLTSIAKADRPVFVVQHNILASLFKSGFRPQSPILDYVRDNFQRAFAVEGYSVWVRNGRTIAPLSTGILLLPTPENVDGKARLEFVLAARTGRIKAIELWNVTEAQWQIITLDAQNTRIDLTRWHLDDTPDGETRPESWPLALNELVRLGLEFKPPANLPPAAAIEAVLIGETGERLGYARVLPSDGLRLPAFTPAGAAPPATN